MVAVSVTVAMFVDVNPGTNSVFTYSDDKIIGRLCTSFTQLDKDATSDNETQALLLVPRSILVDLYLCTSVHKHVKVTVKRVFVAPILLYM